MKLFKFFEIEVLTVAVLSEEVYKQTLYSLVEILVDLAGHSFVIHVLAGYIIRSL